jgi:hypothetical protein
VVGLEDLGELVLRDDAVAVLVKDGERELDLLVLPRLSLSNSWNSFSMAGDGSTTRTSQNSA